MFRTDCGTVVNPDIVAQQSQGAATWFPRP